MPAAFVDARPPGLDLTFRRGTTLTVVFDWPDGQLDGRTFTSTLGEEALSVVVTGDEMTVEATPDQTSAVAASSTAEWRLLEDLGGDDPEPVIVGTWSASDRAAASGARVVVITDDTIQVDVSVFTGGTRIPAGGTTGQVLAKASNADFDLEWVDP